MSKDNKTVNKYKYVARKVDEIVPSVYASLAMALSDYEVDSEIIGEIFALSQSIWEEHSSDMITLLGKCYNTTGIQLMNAKQLNQAIKLGIVDADTTL